MPNISTMPAAVSDILARVIILHAAVDVELP
jgi:hypothetical protein